VAATGDGGAERRRATTSDGKRHHGGRQLATVPAGNGSRPTAATSRRQATASDSTADGSSRRCRRAPAAGRRRRRHGGDVTTDTRWRWESAARARPTATTAWPAAAAQPLATADGRVTAGSDSGRRGDSRRWRSLPAEPTGGDDTADGGWSRWQRHSRWRRRMPSRARCATVAIGDGGGEPRRRRWRRATVRRPQAATARPVAAAQPAAPGDRGSRRRRASKTGQSHCISPPRMTGGGSKDRPNPS